jgi:hypothetical protein
MYNNYYEYNLALHITLVRPEDGPNKAETRCLE